MVRWTLLWLVVVVSLVAAPSLAAGGKGKAPLPPEKPAAAACQVDADCVLVVDGCCDCNAGGKRRAIPRKGRDAHEKKLKASCKRTLCPAVMSQDPSCRVARAICRAGACELGEPRP